MKSPLDYNVYTPKLINELKKLTDGFPRARAIKAIAKRLGICERNARRQYVKYIENDLPIIKNFTENPIGRPIKRLFWDIETSPNLGFFWRAGYDLNITPESITKERRIICIGYKWEHEKDARVLCWDENQDDKTLLASFLKIAEEADEMIGHNGDKFDIPWFRTRCLFHGLQPLPDYKTIDTCSWARRKFYFNSNKLDYIAGYLGIGHKLHTDLSLWKDIMFKDCPKAMLKMSEYCKKDVILLQEVWKRLSACVPAKTHAGVLAGKPSWTCPKDGSMHVKLSKTKVTAGGSVQYQMQCLDCGSYYTINAAAYALYKET